MSVLLLILIGFCCGVGNVAAGLNPHGDAGLYDAGLLDDEDEIIKQGMTLYDLYEEEEEY